MVDGFVQFLNNPIIQNILAAAIYEGGKFIFKKTLGAEKETAGWQLTDSLEKALYQSESDLGWTHDTEAISETFFSTLFPFSKSFNISTLEEVFQKAIGRPISQSELDTWITNVLDQISQPEHETLFRFLQLNHILLPSNPQQPLKPSPILTPGASVWDDQNILARDEFIDGLCADFSQYPRRIQLVGMGGIGKTEILNKLYAKLAAKPAECGFDFVGLVHFSGSIESDLGQQIEYPAQYHGFQGEKAALSYLHDLCIERHVLLLIDDVRAQQPLPKRDDKTLEFLMTLNASVLLASRVPFPQFERRNVDVLPTEECIKIFERQYDRAVDIEEVRSLLTKIIEDKAGQNTLVVNRLGSMAKAPCWSIKELFDQLENLEFSIPIDSANDETLQLEIKKLYTIDETFTPAEINILEAFSIFPAIPLALNLCKEWLSEDAGVEPDECARILARLAQRTWLVRHEGEKGASSPMYSMHQVVREAVKEQRNAEYSKHFGLIRSCKNSLQQSTEKYEFSIAAQIIPFAATIFEQIHEENTAIAVLSDAIGKYYEVTAAYSLALQWRQIAGTLAARAFGIEHQNTAVAYNNLAGVYKEQGDFPKALEWYFKALAISEKVLGKDHPHTAATYSNIALVYHEQGDYPKALEWYYKDLVISVKELGEELPDTSTTYNNIAGVYRSQGDYSKALEWLIKALVIREKEFGKEHPDTAITYNNIAGVYYEQGAYYTAMEWLQKAFLIFEAKLGPDHPSTKNARFGIDLITAKLAESSPT